MSLDTRRELIKAKFHADKLQVKAMMNQRACDKVGDSRQSKLWWQIACAANEQLQAIADYRGIPGAKKPPSARSVDQNCYINMDPE